MKTERPAMSLNVREFDAGSWVIFELPGFATAATGSPPSSRGFWNSISAPISTSVR